MNLLRKGLACLSALALAVAVPELALRVAGYRYEPGVQFGWPRPEHMAPFVPDEELFWRLRPNPVKNVNSLGLPAENGREVVTPKPPGLYRILFFGDSCTYGGYPTYVERLLNERRAGDPRFEAVAMAVPGYTTFQGVRLAHMYGALFEPDLVFLYYGWNDHWRARGAIDADKVVRVARDPWSRTWRWMDAHSRTVQFLRWCGEQVRGEPSDEPLDQPRVPPHQYRENLYELFGIFAAQRVPVVFFTAPTAYYALGVPEEPVANKLVASADEAIRRHRQYNAIVREVALSTGALLLDLEQSLAEQGNLAEIFRSDGIHFSVAGREYAAGVIADFIETRILAQ